MTSEINCTDGRPTRRRVILGAMSSIIPGRDRCAHFLSLCVFTHYNIPLYIRGFNNISLLSLAVPYIFVIPYHRYSRFVVILDQRVVE